MSLAILIPAAGSARRMRGADKLLEPVRGEAILRRLARLALALGGAVRVTLPIGGFEAGRRLALSGLAVETVSLPDAALGMAASLRCGAQMTGSGLMILLPDMPEIGAAEIAAMAMAHQAHPDQVLRGAAQGRPGHPVVLPARLRPALADLTGDQGAKAIIRGENVLLIELPGEAALLDLDSPEDWADWRARREE